MRIVRISILMLVIIFIVIHIFSQTTYPEILDNLKSKFKITRIYRSPYNDNLYLIYGQYKTEVRETKERNDVFLINVKSNYIERHPLPDYSGVGREMIASSDLSKVYFTKDWGDEESIIEFDMKTNTIKTLLTEKGRYYRGLSISQQNDKIAFFDSDARFMMLQSEPEKLSQLKEKGAGVSVLNINDKQKTVLVSPLEALSWSMCLTESFGWSPDGERIAFPHCLKLKGVQRATIYSVKPDGSDLRAEFLDNVFGIGCTPVWIDNEKFIYEDGEQGLLGAVLYEFNTKNQSRRLLYRGPVPQDFRLSADKLNLIFTMSVSENGKLKLVEKKVLLSSQEPLDLTLPAKPNVQTSKEGDKTWRVDKEVSKEIVGLKPEFKVTDDGKTVTDSANKLMWVRDPGDLPLKAFYLWEDPDTKGPIAIKACESLNYAGYSDWRLPTLGELKTIVDSSKSDPSIDTNFFVCKSVMYWTSTVFENDPQNVWYIRFKDGFVGIADKWNGAAIRPVRSLK